MLQSKIEYLMCLSKISYGSERAAKQAINHRKLRRRDLTTYECPYCKGWHVQKSFSSLGHLSTQE